MTIKERIQLYKELFKECKAIEPVRGIYAKEYEQGTPLQRLELIRKLDTELADLYHVWIPVITCFTRDDNYVQCTKEIYLGEPDLEGFLHQFRHHLQNEAREQERKLLLVEDKADLDSRIPYKETTHPLMGEDDARAWARMIMESI